jgi:uncharacterized protein YjaG (DUF416 family)
MDTMIQILDKIKTEEEALPTQERPDWYEMSAAFAVCETFSSENAKVSEAIYELVLGLSQGNLSVVDDWEIADVIRQMLEDRRLTRKKLIASIDDPNSCYVGIEEAVINDMKNERL